MLATKCPSCGWSYRVPDDIIGKAITCQRCEKTLIARCIGGKTVLRLAGVSASESTQAVENDLGCNTPSPMVENDPFTTMIEKAPLSASGVKNSPRAGMGVVLGLASFALVLALGSAAVVSWILQKSPPASAQAGKPRRETTVRRPKRTEVFARADFTRLVLAAKTPEAIAKRFGKPDGSRGIHGEEGWHYYRITRDPLSGEVDTVVFIEFKDGQAVRVDIHP